MAVTNTPIFPQTITSNSVQILPADTNTLKTLYAGGTNGSKIEAIIASNTDSAAAYTLVLTLVTSATNYILGSVNVPLLAGNSTGVPAVNLLASSNIPLPKDANGNPYIYIANGTTLKVNSTSTVTTAKIVSCSCVGGDY